ncbi:hypothetical protein [Candidatus Protochlamydia phocaeensis]|uniref:hypothetical protein n=1 Tax=Candidatus Protochlamydia phocaeensis TaxID=1414722 RepID=UPI000838BF61|nr:hypothetical protein [Candidatus Protochlamydia phocaeensis]
MRLTPFFSRLALYSSIALLAYSASPIWSVSLPDETTLIARGEERGGEHHSAQGREGFQHDTARGYDNHRDYDHHGYENQYGHRNVGAWEGGSGSTTVIEGQGTQYVPYPSSDLPPLPPQQ